MSNLPSTVYDANDYDAIEAAVGSSERGRWFLAEFSKRNRVSDTQTVMSAIEKLQNVVASTQSMPIASKAIQDDTRALVETLRNDLIEMAHKIADTQTEVTAIGLKDNDPKHAALVSGELDAITQSIEFATSEILESAEEIQEIAWTLREGGLAVETCDAIDARSTKIYLACSFQDLTAQRTSKVVDTMRFLENRLKKMIGILQGGEGFSIVDSQPYSIYQKLAPQDVNQQILEQDDVDFALNWGAEPQASSPIRHDNWLDESEIEQTLSPVSSSIMSDVQLLHKSADIIALPVEGTDQEQLIQAACKQDTYELSHIDSSKLDKLDHKSVSEKLSLFT
jgi:chemotaxis regulatin CheY-phosphate phosphatase CheZ